MGRKVKEGKKSYVWIVFLIGVFVFVVIKALLPKQMNHVNNRFIRSCLGLFLCFALVFLLERVREMRIGTIIVSTANFFGKMSLGTYLIHNSAARVFREMDLLTIKSYLIIVICSIVVSIPISLLRNKIYNTYKSRKHN